MSLVGKTDCEVDCTMETSGKVDRQSCRSRLEIVV